MSTLARRAPFLPSDPLTPLMVGLGVGFAGALYGLSAYLVSPFALPAAAVALGYVLVALARPAWAVAGALLAVPLELFHLPVLGGTISPSEGALMIVALGWCFRVLARPEEVVKPSVRDLPILVLLGAVAVGLATAQEPAAVLRVFVLWTLFYFVYLQAQSFDERETRQVLMAFAVGAGILGALGAASYLRSGDIGVLAGGEVTRARAVGTFANPNSYASMLALALLPALALALADVRRNGWLLVPAAGALAGLVLSLSRGGMAGFALGLVLLLAWSRARWVAVALAVAFTGLTLANANPILASDHFEVVEQRLSTLGGGPQVRTSDRPRIWRVALNTAVEHPFFGIGIKQFEFEATRHSLLQRGRPFENAHSIPLSLAAETGLIGLAAFLAWIGQLGVRAVRATSARGGAPAYALALGLCAALTAFLVQSFTIVQLRTPVLAGAFFIFAGLLTGLADRRSPSG